MDRFEGTINLINIAPSLPNRRGKRPITIGRPIHVQCGDHGDGKALRDLMDEVIAWPDIEAGPLPIGSADLISFQVGENVATGEPSVFITEREERNPGAEWGTEGWRNAAANLNPSKASLTFHTIPMHSHDAVEVFFLLSGKIEVLIETGGYFGCRRFSF